jgi:hypothetical protein
MSEATWSRLGALADVIETEPRGPVELKCPGMVTAYLARRHGFVTGSA